MDKYKGMGFKAVDIEHSFATFLEKQPSGRGQSYDADVFRGGHVNNLGKALEDFCNHMVQRLSRSTFDASESLRAGAKIRIESAITLLSGIAKEMKTDNGKEPDDYHWLIVGEMVSIIAGLLDHIEGKGAGEKQ